MIIYNLTIHTPTVTPIQDLGCSNTYAPTVIATRSAISTLSLLTITHGMVKDQEKTKIKKFHLVFFSINN